MSPIISLQRRLVEVGRLRLGTTAPSSSGRGRPVRLERWRLTSRDEQRLQDAAKVYGGEVQPWDGHEGQHVLDTTVDQLPIMLMPGEALSQWMELWSGGGCARRCDGVNEVISGGACLCPQEDAERNEMAKSGKACKFTTRLSVLLPEIAGIGCWRLETHGYYAAVELAKVTELLEQATSRGALLPARLRIDQRSQLRGGKTTHFPVPVVDIDVRVTDVLALGAGAVAGEIVALEQPVRAALPAAAEAPVRATHTPVPLPVAEPVPSVKDALGQAGARAAAAKPRANAAAPMGPAGVGFSTSPIPVDGDEPSDAGVSGDTGAGGAPTAAPEPAVALPAAGPAPDSEGPPVVYATEAQRKLLFATAKERGVPQERIREALREVTGQESTAAIPKSLFSAVLTAVQGAQVAA